MKCFKTFLIEEEIKKKWFERTADLRKRSAAQIGRDLFATGVVMSGVAQVGTDIMGFLDKALSYSSIIESSMFTLFPIFLSLIRLTLSYKLSSLF